MKLFSKNVAIAILVFFSVALVWSLFSNQFRGVEEVTLSELVSDINAGTVESIVVQGNDVEITTIDGTVKKTKKESDISLFESLTNYGASPELLRQTSIDISEPSGFLFWAGALLPFLIPFLLIIGFFWFATRNVQRSNLQAFNFGQSRARVIMPDDKKQRVTFGDVAGVEEAKEELTEIVDFLKNPVKFSSIGARIPKGVLLMGAPGTGKTLLARAVAGEAGVPFFHLSASEFVEMFVGVGASRVRDLFKMAKRSAPSIVFIDEIDAVGRHRGAGLGGGHDEREQTLNQILVELDGFEPHESVIVMAATNRPDVLDPALLRPGRFDRRVVLDLPDIKDREAILKIHARNKHLAADVNFRRIAERTPGFSGADLQNLINEAAIWAARKNRRQITLQDILSSIEKVLLGPERKSKIISQEEKKITAYHEAGHALVAAVLPEADPVHKVTIISRGRAGGYTLKLPSQDRRLVTKTHFMGELAVALGGYAAEKIVFQELTTGASNDLRTATDIARSLVTRYGMSDKLGPVVFGGKEESIFLGKEFGMHHERDYSEEIAGAIDKEVSSFIKRGLTQAQTIIKKYRTVLDAIAHKLIEQESLEREEFNKLVKSFGIKPKPIVSS
ncbi:MAG: cell division protein FtsH [Candidatus Niyogibacteria bacterium CG10_big_fil_rev_8_21_14_0_10_46_36]|uniref:ATP-dependent zinc metalloprotease FtsH n=1 Tax=Candidatus Niyogibacteria bacterium CG10_big_fil_rev_8_21_14_0_10_46_36 TaxID=1974726 RepID=A0A2H0TFG4_9BACT|nr:MAG: cell division protein FtsH [Candidatus Niyogibacteria bacterium CG10_big_fil_rev_8_21_14_0_10_46_36]